MNFLIERQKFYNFNFFLTQLNSYCQNNKKHFDVSKVVKYLFFNKKIIDIKLNSLIDVLIIEDILNFFKIDYQFIAKQEIKKKIIEKKTILLSNEQSNVKQQRSLIVGVVGNVDSGKTSLLDFFSKNNYVKNETGSITQNIRITYLNFNKKKIIWLDTPGHAAFEMLQLNIMKCADLIFLLIDVSDKKAIENTSFFINFLKKIDNNLIILFNKIDKLKNTSEIFVFKEQLLKKGLELLEFNGLYESYNISVFKKTGLEVISKKILEYSTLLNLDDEDSCKILILNNLYKKNFGLLSLIVVLSGVLIHNIFLNKEKQLKGKVKRIFDIHFKNKKEALLSELVLISGLNTIGCIGEIFIETNSLLALSSVSKLEKNTRTFISKGKVVSSVAKYRKKLFIVTSSEIELSAMEKIIEKFENFIELRIKHLGLITKFFQLILDDSSNKNFLLIFFSNSEKFLDKNKRIIEKFHLKQKEDIYFFNFLYDLESCLQLLFLDKTFLKEFKKNKAKVKKVFIMKKFIIIGCSMMEGTFTKNFFVSIYKNKILLFKNLVIKSIKIKNEEKFSIKKKDEFGLLLNFPAEKLKKILKGDFLFFYEKKMATRD